MDPMTRMSTPNGVRSAKKTRVCVLLAGLVALVWLVLPSQANAWEFELPPNSRVDHEDLEVDAVGDVFASFRVQNEAEEHVVKLDAQTGAELWDVTPSAIND